MGLHLNAHIDGLQRHSSYFMQVLQSSSWPNATESTIEAILMMLGEGSFFQWLQQMTQPCWKKNTAKLLLLWKFPVSF